MCKELQLRALFSRKPSPATTVRNTVAITTLTAVLRTPTPSSFLKKAVTATTVRNTVASTTLTAKSKQAHAVLIFYFHWHVAANQSEHRCVRFGMIKITVHSAGRDQRLSLSHVPNGTLHSQLRILPLSKSSMLN